MSARPLAIPTTQPELLFEVDSETLLKEVLFSPERHKESVGAPLVLPLLPLMALFLGASSLGLGIGSFLRSRRDHEGTQAMLTEIKKDLASLLLGQKDILNELQQLRNEVEWTQIVTLIGGPVGTIQHFWDEMKALLPPTGLNQAQIDSWLQARETEIRGWAEAVLDERGLRLDLSRINSAFQGTGGLHKPLMQIVAERVTSRGFKSQSPYFIAVTKFRSILYYEALAISTLCAAYKAKHPAATDQQIKDYVAPYTAQSLQQVDSSRQYLDPLNRFWTKPGTNIGMPSPIEWGNGIVYVDPHKVQTDDGYVVIGLQLYKKGNRLALKILEAQLDRAGEINVSSKREKTNDEWGETYFQVEQNKDLTLMTTSVPDGCMVTGVELSIEGNKMMVLLEHVPFDFTRLTADFTKRAWTSRSDAKETPCIHWNTTNLNAVKDSQDPQGRAGTMYIVIPDPPSPTVGVELIFNSGAGQWCSFLGVGVRTDFYRA